MSVSSFDPKKEKRTPPAPINLSEKAVAVIKDRLAENPDAIAIRVNLTTKGCSGTAFEMSYATEKKPGEELVEKNGAKILLPLTATMYLLGSTLDWVTGELGNERFDFVNNPNEEGRCGCGESVMLKKSPPPSLAP